MHFQQRNCTHGQWLENVECSGRAFDVMLVRRSFDMSGISFLTLTHLLGLSRWRRRVKTWLKRRRTNRNRIFHRARRDKKPSLFCPHSPWFVAKAADDEKLTHISYLFPLFLGSIWEIPFFFRSKLRCSERGVVEEEHHILLGGLRVHVWSFQGRGAQQEQGRRLRLLASKFTFALYRSTRPWSPRPEMQPFVRSS